MSPKRYRLRYSLRTVMLVVAGLSLWIGWNARIVHARRDELSEMRARGVYFTERPIEAGIPSKICWMRRRLGDVELLFIMFPQSANDEQITATAALFPEAVWCRIVPPNDPAIKAASTGEGESLE